MNRISGWPDPHNEFQIGFIPDIKSDTGYQVIKPDSGFDICRDTEFEICITIIHLVY